jgi:hypothetical protein
MALRDSIAETPPNLRTGTARANCMGCQHGVFKQGERNGQCGLYGGFKVRATQVCDSYEAKSGRLAGALNGGGTA